MISKLAQPTLTRTLFSSTPKPSVVFVSARDHDYFLDPTIAVTILGCGTITTGSTTLTSARFASASSYVQVRTYIPSRYSNSRARRQLSSLIGSGTWAIAYVRSNTGEDSPDPILGSHCLCLR